MRKQILLLTTITILFSLAANAQERFNNKKISVGIIAGGNYHTIAQKSYYGHKMKSDFIAGFHVGAHAEFRILSHFYIRPGILYTTKGYVWRTEIYGIPRKFTYRLSYLEMPVNLLFKQPLGKGKFIFGLGPYFAVALNGKEKSDFGKKNLHFKNSLSSTDHYLNEYFKSIDAGANLLIGYQLRNGFSVQFNGQYGFTDIIPSGGAHRDVRKDSKKNRGFGVSIGYRF